jgi:Rad3-related DNA helicase
MKRLKFNSQGKLESLDGLSMKTWQEEQVSSHAKKIERRKLKTSESLEFLKPENQKPKSLEGMEEIFDKSHWNLNDKSGPITPLEFSNGKTQEDLVKEIVKLIEEKNKIIFLHGACGTGKSAIALNVARILGKTSIVVPVKNLQRQYEEDYMGKMFINKQNGQKMKIAMMTGRENHDSIILPGKSCAYQELPENIKITEKNYLKLTEYFEQNPFLSGHAKPELKHIRRLTIAPSNPYWSPIIPSEFDLNQMKDAKKIKYSGCSGRDYTFYHRKPGCSYYDQYLAYTKADIIIFNAAKYKAELSIGRKPATEVEIIDEADEFLDSLFVQEEINLTRFANSLATIVPETLQTKETIDELLNLIKLEEQGKRAVGVDESQVFGVKETQIEKILKVLQSNKELEAEITIDELNYSNKALEVSKSFPDNFKDIYLTYRKDDENLYVKLVSTNLGPKIQDLLDKSKSLVFMSGTLHSKKVLENIFGIKNFKTVEAETIVPGAIEIIMTGREFDCKYSNFATGNYSREEYLTSLSFCVEKAKNPSLIHVNAFLDLPSEEEKTNFNIGNVMSQEKLREIQGEDKTGKTISKFKQGLAETLFSTKCTRGVDFPGNTCNSIVFTKYPNPNVSNTFWKILQKTHPQHFWDFYRDKAYREFLQRIYRAVRSKDDHVYILSPDLRVLNSVRKLQNGRS